VIADNGLREALRTLKLSGILETLDARLAQARGGELGHLEFLQVLCGDEIARRDQAAFTRRLRRARFDEQVTLEGFDFAANPKLPTAQIRDLAALRWLHAGESVTSPVRSGSARRSSPRPWATWPSAAAPTSASPRPAASWPNSPAVTPTTAGPADYASSPGPRC